MAEGGKQVGSSGYELSDSLIWKLSKSITSGTRLLDLGILVLGISREEVEGAEYNKRTIQEAAGHVLHEWRIAQKNRREAFQELSRKLWSTKYFRTLAAELQEWAEEEQKEKETSDPRQKLELDELQNAVKQALIDRFEDFLKNDWLNDEDARAMSVEVHYAEPEWTQTIKGRGLEDKTGALKGGLYQILEESQGRLKVFVSGKPGSGKTSALAKLALDWAQDSSTPKPETGLHKFSFMFVVTLRDVDSNDSLEDVIVQQYEEHGLDPEHKSQIKAVLKRLTTLIAFDGYDEYKKGTNCDIDAVISGKSQMSYIVTSRPGDHLEKKYRQKMTEVQITGLSQRNIRKCATQYLDTAEDRYKSKRMISEAKRVGIFPKNFREKNNLLETPIVLLLVCILFDEKEAVPETKTEIVQEIIDMLIERSVTKGKLGEKEPEEMQKILQILGQLSWQASQKDTKQLYLDKSEIQKAHKDILNLGLLHGSMEPEKSSRHKQPKWMTYPHNMIQDFLAGLFAAELTKEEVQAMFPTWKDIESEFEVVKFMCGLRDDPSDVIDHICQQFVDDWIHGMRTDPGNKKPVDVNLLLEIGQETKGKSVNPLCNDHIYYVQSLPLRRQSKLYLFKSKLKNMKDEVSETILDTPASPTCVVWIEQPSMPHHEVVAATSSLNQKLTDLYVYELNVGEYNGLLWKMDDEARSLYLSTIHHRLMEENWGHKLQVIHIPNQPALIAEVIQNLAPKTNLTFLNLEEGHLSAEQCLLLCEQLQFIHRLTHLNLDGNDIGSTGTAMLGESITCWGSNPPLQELSLGLCRISAAGCVPLMKALQVCKKLSNLNLNGNPIGGTFEALDSTVVYPRLKFLDMLNAWLFEEDIKSIALLISSRRMPKLSKLWIGYEKAFLIGKFRVMLESESDEMLRVWQSIVQNVENVTLGQGLAMLDMLHQDLTKEAPEVEQKRRRGIIEGLETALNQVLSSESQYSRIKASKKSQTSDLIAPVVENQDVKPKPTKQEGPHATGATQEGPHATGATQGGPQDRGSQVWNFAVILEHFFQDCKKKTPVTEPRGAKEEEKNSFISFLDKGFQMKLKRRERTRRRIAERREAAASGKMKEPRVGRRMRKAEAAKSPAGTVKPDSTEEQEKQQRQQRQQQALRRTQKELESARRQIAAWKTEGIFQRRKTNESSASHQISENRGEIEAKKADDTKKQEWTEDDLPKGFYEDQKEEANAGEKTEDLDETESEVTKL